MPQQILGRRRQLQTRVTIAVATTAAAVWRRMQRPLWKLTPASKIKPALAGPGLGLPALALAQRTALASFGVNMHNPFMLDAFDLKILALWQQRGDIGPVEMAESIHLSASQCSRRMAALKHAGHVRGFHAVLDPAAVGVGLMAYVLLTMKSHSPEAAEAFRARILGLDEVMECHKLTGEADLILKVATRDLASFNQLLSHRILAAPEVATARSSIILDEVKSTTALPIRV